MNPGVAVAPGNHDGVHRGHRTLVSTAKSIADTRGLKTAAMFFDPHPQRVTRPDLTAETLTLPDRREELLLGAGADQVFLEPFDREFSLQSPTEFVKAILVEKYNTKAIVVGPDFRFGTNRGGNFQTLEELGEKFGFTAHEVPPVIHAGEPVSSTRLRNLLHRGDVQSAADLMTRIHDVRGTVVRGDQRGRTIGFPTANLDCRGVLLPKDGVYAVIGRTLDPAGPILHGVANLGVRPTFMAGRSVEVHFFDFDEDIYDAELRIGFVSHLRDEKKFDGLDALQTQIRRDVDAAKSALREANQEFWSWL